jgi:hypothetical protein
LRCESVGNKGGLKEVIVGGNAGGDASDTHIELDVDESKRGVLTSRGGVFARAHEKEKGDADHVSNRVRVGGAMRIGVRYQMVYDGNWNGLDTIRRWVGFGIAG